MYLFKPLCMVNYFQFFSNNNNNQKKKKKLKYFQNTRIYIIK